MRQRLFKHTKLKEFSTVIPYYKKYLMQSYRLKENDARWKSRYAKSNEEHRK